jgi:hypothetical protein
LSTSDFLSVSFNKEQEEYREFVKQKIDSIIQDKVSRGYLLLQGNWILPDEVDNFLGKKRKLWRSQKIDLAIFLVVLIIVSILIIRFGYKFMLIRMF